MKFVRDTAPAEVALESVQRLLEPRWETQPLPSITAHFNTTLQEGHVLVILPRLSVLSNQRPRLLFLLNLSIVFLLREGLSKYCSLTD